MTSLRWILLLLGLLFIAGLAWRELRRGRQDAAGSDARPRRTEPLFEPAPEMAAANDFAVPRELPIIDWPGEEIEVAEVPVAATAAPAVETPVEEASLTESPAMVAAQADAPPRPSIAEWPPEDVRRICSLRLMPRRQERFSGRTLRQGLLSIGFQHGELGIFHMAGGHDRAMISVANLARPGLLDPSMMDYQRFLGLQLFTVLPGRLPAGPTLQQLFSVAQELAGRVDGSVRDETGGPLNAERMASLLRQFADDVPASSEH